MPDKVDFEILSDTLNVFYKMYDIVRLVDPINKRVINYQKNHRMEIGDICYDYWKNGKICDNCISIRAHMEGKYFLKLEQLENITMIVTAITVDNTKQPLVVELLKNVSDSMMVGCGDYAKGRMIGDVLSQINEMIVKDELTGLNNRRFVNERLPADIVKATLEKTPLSVLFFDIDNFKEINDSCGHSWGDRMIIEAAKAIRSCIRENTDWVARYGGDEYLVCLNQTSQEEAYRIAEEIRREVANLRFPEKDDIQITLSIGSYTMEDSPLTAEELIALADQRMYEAKRHGKNYTFAGGKE